MLVGVRTALREIERVGDLAVRMRVIVDHVYHFSLLIFVADGHFA